jgi:hypothetical protein
MSAGSDLESFLCIMYVVYTDVEKRFDSMMELISSRVVGYSMSESLVGAKMNAINGPV